MTGEEKQKAINALKISAPIMAMTQEEFNDYIQTLNKIMDWLEQEPCEDVISREEAIDACNQSVNILEATDRIKDLPSVYPKAKEQKWIPVSEGLPQQFRFVNCTCHSLIDDREDWVIDTVYIPQLSDSPYSDWGNIPMLNWKDAEVVAWMYRDIPKPYKEESEDKE